MIVEGSGTAAFVTNRFPPDTAMPSGKTNPVIRTSLGSLWGFTHWLFHRIASWEILFALRNCSASLSSARVICRCPDAAKIPQSNRSGR